MRPADDLIQLPLICAGQLPPAFIEYALRDGAAGVVLASCRDDGCEWRLGARWVSARLAGAREPALRLHSRSAAVHLVQADHDEPGTLQSAIDQLRAHLATTTNQRDKAQHVVAPDDSSGGRLA